MALGAVAQPGAHVWFVLVRPIHRLIPMKSPLALIRCAFVLLFALSGPLVFFGQSAPVAEIETSQTSQPFGQGFWKNNPGAWPVTSLTIGGQTYSQTQLLTVLNIPPRGNATLILADQLIACLLNIANGCAAAPVATIVADAQARLSGINLLAALQVKSSSSAGQKMIHDAEVLESYNSGALTPTSAVTGTASLGAAIANANLTLVDANGTIISGTTGSDGTFVLGSATLTPPFLVRVVTSAPSGNFAAGTVLYSVSTENSASTTINVHVLSDLMVRSFYSAQGIDVDDAFANPTGSNAAPTPVAVEALANLVLPTIKLWLDDTGIVATSGTPTDGSINLISSPFVAYPPGVIPPDGTLDAVLHEIVSELVNGSGAVEGVTLTGGTITETISPTYGSDAITFRTHTVDSSTGTASDEIFSGLALTAALQPAIDGINARLALLQETVNTKGAALTGADVLPFFAPDYVNDGMNANDEADAFAAENAGIIFSNVRLLGINSFNAVTGVADVLFGFTASVDGQTDSGTSTFIFKQEGGTWLIYGNQRIALAWVAAQSRTSQGAQTLGPGVFSGQYIFAGVRADANFSVTGSSVSGPLPIWDNLFGAPLFQGAQLLENGHTFTTFYRLSQKLSPVQFPPPGTLFLLNLTAPGTPQYPATSNAFTTEVIQFTGISNVPGSGPLSAVLGKTLTYHWTLPQTYTIGDIELFAYVYDGPSNNPATHSVVISANTMSAPNSTSGEISIPADLSAYGLGAIKQVDVFLEVQGAHGESNLVELRYPY